MANRMRPRRASVTGVATGSLGTGTALDDTQIYAAEALAPEPEPEAEPVRVASAAEPARSAVAPAQAWAMRRKRRATGGYPVGVLTAVVIALVTVAAVLTMRDGVLVAGGATGPVNAGAASFPPPPSFGQIGTAAPAAKPATHHHGHGHGHGD